MKEFRQKAREKWEGCHLRIVDFLKAKINQKSVVYLVNNFSGIEVFILNYF
jgi:hypothetical protein